MSSTSGIWSDEKQSAAAFDRFVEPSGLFSIYREVWGDLTQPRPGQQYKRLRIDRVLVPTPKLIGWTGGCIGVEFKRSELKIGRPISQMLDYSRSLWVLSRGIRIGLDWTFLWPAEKEHGDLASVFAQQRIGTAFPVHGGVDFFSGEVRVLTIASSGTFTIGQCQIGNRTGSR